MRYYGPYAPVAGQLTQVQIDPSSQSVEIENDSTYDLLLAIQDQQPSIIGGAPGSSFHNGVKPYSSKCLAIPQQPPNSSFSGTVWVLPIDNGGLAANGELSTRAIFSVISYGAGEQVLSTTSMPREQNAVSQQRVISLAPALPAVKWTGAALAADAVQMGNFAVPTAGNTAALWVGALAVAGGQIWNAYFYLLVLAPNDTASAGGVDFTLQASIIRTPGNVVLFGPVDFYRDQVNWSGNAGNNSPIRQNWTQPLRIQFVNPGQVGSELEISFKTQGVANPTSGISWTMLVVIDSANSGGQAPLPIGNPSSAGGIF